MINKIKPKRTLEFYRKRKTHGSLYSVSILIGVCMAVYMYVFNINDYFESMFVLVRRTLLWFIPIVFGYYGFIAQWMHINFEKHHFRRPIDLLISVSKKLPAFFIRPVFNMLHFPLFIMDKSPLFLAISSLFIGLVWLLIFFVVIFPRL